MPKPSADQVKFFEENGYLKVGLILSDEELAAVRAASEREFANLSGEIVMENGVEKPVVRRVSKLIRRDEVFLGAAAHPIVADYLFALLGSPFEICLNRHNMLMVKAPYHGGQVDWHQDAGGWQCNKFVSLMVMLDDATLANGCLQIVPGIYRHPELQNPGNLMDLSVAKNLEFIKNAIPIECKAGEGFFFHSLTPHMSAPNRSPMYRRSLNFAYIASRDWEFACKLNPLESITIHRGSDKFAVNE